MSFDRVGKYLLTLHNISCTLRGVTDISTALRDAIAKRMAELDLSPSTLADKTGLTQQGLLPLRQGQRKHYQVRLTAPVCRLFGWTSDSIDRLLAGQEPQLLSTPPADVLSDLRGRIEALERSVEVLLVDLDERESLAADVRREAGAGGEPPAQVIGGK